MNLLYRFILGLALLNSVISVISASEIPCENMPDGVYAIFKQALEEFPDNPRQREGKSRNIAALDKLRKLEWPAFSKLERVALNDLKDSKKSGRLWRVKWNDLQPGKSFYLSPDFNELELDPLKYSKAEVVEYGEELIKLVDYLKKRDPKSKRSWDFTYIQDFGALGLPYLSGVFLLNHAYSAAYFEKKGEAIVLIHEALRQSGLAVEQMYEEGAWQNFFRGTQMLEEGKARTEVLLHWEGGIKSYAASRFTNQLTEYVRELKAQVEEDKILAANAVADFEKLPENERIDYLIARFPDVHGQQSSQPGKCSTIGFGGLANGGTSFSDAIVKIGRPAVPALIEHLTDTRLTRSIGYWRNFAPSRTVLRVQDVAIECICHILDVPFYQSTSTSSYMSTEKPELRKKVIDDVKAWWLANGRKRPVDGYLARLDAGRIYERLDNLTKIEKIDPAKIDSIATLKRWAKDTHYSELPEIAKALAQRGDLSMLSEMRQMMRDSSRDIPHECVWFVMRHGELEDFQFLREAATADLAKGANLGTSKIFGSVAFGVESSDNPLAVPILIDFLSERKISGSRWISERKGAMGFSCADSCMGTLIKLTGHNEGYENGSQDEDRFAAIDRWIEWWTKQGQEEFLKKHPDVGKMFGPK